MAEETPTFWLGRQPILDRRAATVAFELLFRPGNGHAPAVGDEREAAGRIIGYAFSELGLASVLGHCRGFIHFDAELLMSDVVETLPPEHTVIELLATADITSRTIERCRELHGRGFSLALDDVGQLDAAPMPLLPFIDIIKINALGGTAETLTPLVRKARATASVKLLAENVNSRAHADSCRALGFDLFQGYFFARPTMLEGRHADPSKRQLMHLLEQTLDDNDNSAIEQTFKQSPELSYKLMRLVNSVGVGGGAPIQSLHHALAILGRRQLQRWLQVLLFGHQSTGPFPSALLQMAAARGKLMELLAQQRSDDEWRQDRAFMAGILSLLDALLEVPMAEVIAQLRLPDDVRDALLRRAGPLGHLLQVVEALERTEDGRVSELLATGDPCSVAELPALQIEAFKWSNVLGQERER